MATYLVLVEGVSHEVTPDGRPAWSFTVRRRIRAGSEAEAKSAAIGRVAREWAARAGRGRGAPPGLRVLELRKAGWIEAWWRGRGGFAFRR